MTLERFKEGVKIFHQIKNIEDSLRVLERREAKSLVMELNSLECAQQMKKALAEDLNAKLKAAQEELESFLATG